MTRQTENKITDVAVVGGGLAGMLTAYLLAREGKKVSVFEKKKIGHGATEYTTAFLTEVIDTQFKDLITIYGYEQTKAIIASHRRAITLVETISTTEKIDCDFKRVSNFSYANTKKELHALKDEYKSMKKLNMPVRYVESKNSHGFRNEGFIELKHQAKYDCEKFIIGLTEILKKKGVKIFEGVEITDVTAHNSGTLVHLEAKNMSIDARHVVIATYEPFNKPLKLYFKKAFYTSYVMTAEIPKHSISEGIYEDTKDPYHYFRIDPHPTISALDLITIGGEDHRSDVHVSKVKSFKALENYLQKILLHQEYKIVEKWTGPILEPVDGLAYIGSVDHKNILYAMAFSGNGMTYSGISAMIFRDTILGKKNAWQDIYRANRIPTAKSLAYKARDYGIEFFQGAVRNTVKFRN
jgi:glycine/D-amino acid oxidase-like deaminating enzyme